MKKIIGKIKNAFQKAGSILSGILGPQPELRPIPVRAERVYRRK
ncbi:MAG: hypothetical protein NT121_16820 [Chloroflexi bacterium]|nr:hypothetical protein [Chloroflexota bacterium]